MSFIRYKKFVDREKEFYANNQDNNEQGEESLFHNIDLFLNQEQFQAHQVDDETNEEGDDD